MYRAIYDAAMTPRSDIDHNLSPPPRFSVRTSCARTQAHPSPASLHLWIGQWTPVNGPSCVVCAFVTKQGITRGMKSLR